MVYAAVGSFDSTTAQAKKRMQVTKYERTNRVHKRILELSEEIASLSNDLIMDGNAPEQQVNVHLGEIMFIIESDIEYRLQLIRNLIK